MKVRYYCCNYREKGEEDDNVVHDMYGYWDIESQSWVAGDLPAAGPYCGTCGSEATETEEVPDHTEDPMESPSEGVLMDYRHEIHDYLVEKGEREE
jgi:hypothetical protein